MLQYEPTQRKDHAIANYVYVINNLSLISFTIQLSLNSSQKCLHRILKSIPNMHLGTMLNNLLSANRTKPFNLKPPNS